MADEKLRIVGDELFFDGWKVATIDETIPSTVLGKFKKELFSANLVVCPDCEKEYEDD